MQFVMYAVIMILIYIFGNTVEFTNFIIFTDKCLYHAGGIYIGGKGIVTGTMETGALTSFIVYALQIIGSLMMVTFVFVMIMIAGASATEVTASAGSRISGISFSTSTIRSVDAPAIMIMTNPVRRWVSSVEPEVPNPLSYS